MTSSRPYLIRALYQWIVDNDMTPYIVVDATVEGIVVPTQHVRDGQIVLNISPRAVNQLRLSNDEVGFNARFGGAAMQVSIPPWAV
ncbi:MAG: ClpXP protease specificity-enhancing factor SspB, partial [Pseudomonadota bacterium]